MAELETRSEPSAWQTGVLPRQVQGRGCRSGLQTGRLGMRSRGNGSHDRKRVLNIVPYVSIFPLRTRKDDLMSEWTDILQYYYAKSPF